MKLSPHIKKAFVEIICLLYALLFVYAATSKLLDFENFQVQIGQSPLLSTFAGPVSWIVPIIEIIISMCLFTQYRLIGLYAALFLMVLFCCYIVIILNFSPFVPCSCGGVLEKFTWTGHLLFNIFYYALAVLGVFLLESERNSNYKRQGLFRVTGLSALGIGLLTFLFFLSENMMRFHNNFVRRFPHHPAMLDKVMDIGYNSYYIAGEGSGYVYLGNKTAPFTVLVVDGTLENKKEYRISLPEGNFSFHSPRLLVRYPNFYIWDGSAALVLWGNVTDWQAKLWDHNTAYFNAFEPIAPDKALVRAISSERKENVLGILSIDSIPHIELFPVLEKQSDGIFDTHGTLLYNSKVKKIIYAYSFRNQYLVAGSDFKNPDVAHTIDTFSKARIKVKYMQSSKATGLASPGYVVNSIVRTYGNYLFVKSEIMGKYEAEEMWDESSIIDVYDLNNFSYRFSFYLTDIKSIKLSDFIPSDSKMFMLSGRYLSSFKLSGDFYQE